MPALIVLGTCVFGLGTLSAPVPRWIVIYLGAVLILFWFVRAKIEYDKTDLIALCVWAYTGLSLSWSLDPLQGFYSFINFTALALVFFAARHGRIEWIPETALVSIWVCLVLLLVYPWDFGGHGNRNFVTEFILIALFLAAASRSWWFVLWMLTVAVCGFYLTINESKIEWLLVPLVLCRLTWLFWSRGSSPLPRRGRSF